MDFRIVIPADHPSGIYWFRPHVHGISLNQVSSGLAGIISIGDVHDYASNAPRRIRHLILKDMQVLAAGTLHYDYDKSPVKVTDGEVQNQQIADFCEPPDNGGPASRHGYCDGEPASSFGNSFVNSRWYFTINGQVFPTIRVTAPDGEIWRLTNASAQVSYRLELVDDATNRPILMQLLAIDGASISVPRGTQAGTVMAIGGNKFTSADCPSSGGAMLPVCVSDPNNDARFARGGLGYISDSERKRCHTSFKCHRDPQAAQRSSWTGSGNVAAAQARPDQVRSIKTYQESH